MSVSPDFAPPRVAEATLRRRLMPLWWRRRKHNKAGTATAAPALPQQR